MRGDLFRADLPLLGSGGPPDAKTVHRVNNGAADADETNEGALRCALIGRELRG